MKEEWRPVKEYEGLYEISNMGRFRSIDRVILSSGINRKIKGKLIKLGTRKTGRKNAQLWRNGKLTSALVNRLVYQAFKGDLDDTMVIDHIDRNPSNNHVSNLRQVTHRENSANRNQEGTSSKYIGVSWIKKYQKWSSWIHRDGRNRFLGYFDCEEKAHHAYQSAKRELKSLRGQTA